MTNLQLFAEGDDGEPDGGDGSGSAALPSSGAAGLK